MSSSRNPFSQFAAGGGGGGGDNGGWLTTKRKGRDDDRIQRDKEKALRARKDAAAARRKKPVGDDKKATTTHANNKRKKKTKPKKRRSSIYDSDDEDLDDFIVDDDEELEQESSSESDYSEVQIVPRKRQQSKAKTTVLTVDISSEDNGDSDNESVPEQSTRVAVTKGSTRGPRHPAVSKKPVTMNLSSDDDDVDSDVVFEGSSLAVGNRRGAAYASKDDEAKKKKKRSALEDASNRGTYSEEKKQDDLSSSDESLELVASSTSRFFAKQQANRVTMAGQKDKSKDNSTRPSKPAVRKRAADDSLDESDDSLDWTSAKRPGSKALKSRAKHALDDSSDEDDPSFQGAGVDSNDFADEDAEMDALAWAVAESTKTHKKEARKRLKNGIKRKKKKKKRQVVVDIDSSSEEEELLPEEFSDGEVEQEDAYVERDAKEAVSVLQATTELSAKVIKAMAGWSQEQDGEAVPAGIIVDGALSMFQCDQVNESNHSWITQDVMKRVCPEVTLSDYQLIGVNWLALLHGLTYAVDGKEDATNVNGVLADEMGLGKTVQTIAFLAWLRYHNRKKNGLKEPEVVALDQESNADDRTVNLLDDVDNGDTSHSSEGYYTRPHIIVVPASVLSNWKREFDTFCPDMHVVVYHGTMAEREHLRDEMRIYLPGRNGFARANAYTQLDVVLTTFSYFNSEKPDDRNFLRKFSFDYLVVDEAHCLKNPRGLRYRNLDKFDTSHRLLLTGTPVQNSPSELMSLLCFLMPLFSHTKGGGLYFEEDTKENDGGERMLQHFVSLQSSDASKDDANEAAYKKLKQLLAPFVLRRRKADVLKQMLPEKTQKVEFVPFDDTTRSVYSSILSAHISKKENGSTSTSASAQQHLFTALRKAANHPLLLRTRHTSEEAMSHLAKNLHQYGYFGRHETCTVNRVREELEQFSDFDLHCAALELIDENHLRREELGRYTLSEEDLFCSPKFARLRTLLPQLIEKGHRVLIFSQWTRCLDLLGCLMESLNLKYLRMDGSKKVGERQSLIDTFNQDDSIPVFLLSTRAGGMGINLTAADVCILHDLDFNPFNDIQAQDRCHRIGQTKPVTVIKMVTEETVDMDIYEMQQRKAKMNAAILESGSIQNNAKIKKEEEAEKKSMIEKAIHRFDSPPPKSMERC